MTGLDDGSLVAWLGVFLGAGGVAGTISFFVKLGRSQERINVAHNSAAAALAQVQQLSRDLADSQIAAARVYATHAAIGDAEGRLNTTMNSLRTDVRNLSDRIDRFLDAFRQHPQQGM